METNSSGEDLVVKTRKPYTITKQREKWTEEEHNKFIEALKLYGRAWQRIEEHIGTKTAVQIRSHAQKFFTKLEKEAVTKGFPFGQAQDIEIPPPRPKRKPSSPYPRKTGSGFFTASTEPVEEKSSISPSPLSVCMQVTEIENSTSCKIQGAKDSHEDVSAPEVLDLFQEAPAASISSLNRGSSNLGAFKGFMPLEKEMKGNLAFKGPSLSIEVDKNVNKDSIGSQTKPVQEERTYTSKQPERNGPLLMNNLQSNQSHMKNVHVDFMKTNEAPIEAPKPSLNSSAPLTSSMNTNSGISSIHQTFPSFPTFSQFPADHDAHQSLFNITSTFSSLIVSTLLQNPAAHAAATMAASFWPPSGVDSSIGSSPKTQPLKHTNSSPSLAAIAAATVAAASAWWAAQGLLPMYPPLHPGFAFGPGPSTTIPAANASGAPNNNRKGDQISIGINQQVIDPEHSQAVRAQQPSAKSSPSSSSDSDESARVEREGANSNKFLSSDGAHEVEKARDMKKLDRSSCGSNMSSEVETDVAAEKKDEETTEEGKEVQLNNPVSWETSIRRLRYNNGNLNESWKEVSEEGRMAFLALFRRGVLPQSFSPPHLKNSIMTVEEREASGELPVDLNEKASNEPIDLYVVQGPSTGEVGYGKLKTRRTGFKPYKRCSIEAKESSSTANGDEASNKRIRLEGETSI